MNPEFKKIMDQMEPLLAKLKESCQYSFDEVKGYCDIPNKGVYVFYENDEPIYVGRSNGIRSRIKNHGDKNSTHKQAH